MSSNSSKNKVIFNLFTEKSYKLLEAVIIYEISLLSVIWNYITVCKQMITNKKLFKNYLYLIGFCWEGGGSLKNKQLYKKFKLGCTMKTIL